MDPTTPSTGKTATAFINSGGDDLPQVKKFDSYLVNKVLNVGFVVYDPVGERNQKPIYLWWWWLDKFLHGKLSLNLLPPHVRKLFTDPKRIEEALKRYRRSLNMLKTLIEKNELSPEELLKVSSTIYTARNALRYAPPSLKEEIKNPDRIFLNLIDKCPPSAGNKLLEDLEELFRGEGAIEI